MGECSGIIEGVGGSAVVSLKGWGSAVVSLKGWGECSGIIEGVGGVQWYH